MIKARRSSNASGGDVQALRAVVDGLSSNRVPKDEYISLLERCTAARSLPLGRRVHAHISEAGGATDTFVNNALIKMYGKCGSPDDAAATFAAAKAAGLCNSYTWSHLIFASAHNGRGAEALHWAANMALDGARSTSFSFVACTAGAASLGSQGLVQGRRIHSRIKESGLAVGSFLGASLIGMYGKCGSIAEARAVYDAMPPEERCIVSCTSLVTAYAQNGHFTQALEVFRSFQGDPDVVLYLSAITACTSSNRMEDGQQIHARVKKQGLETDSFVGNALVTMYSKFGMFSMAKQAFDAITNKTFVSWNAMIAANAQEGQRSEAMQLLRQMHAEGIKMGPVTFVNALSACTTKAALRDGRWIHGLVAGSIDVANDFYVATALVTMYGKCGRVQEARQVFDAMAQRNEISWTAMVSAYAQNDKGREAVQIYKEMNGQGLKPGRLTFVSALDACACTGSLEDGTAIHARVVETGLERDVFVRTALIDMYGKCGNVDVARGLFEGMHDRNLVTWTSMIGAYVLNGDPKEALYLFNAMEGAPNEATLLGVLNACAAVGALEQGKAIHERILATFGYEKMDVAVGNSLLNMYGKCASIQDVVSTFGRLRERNVVTWTTLMDAFAQVGLYRRSRGTMYRMQLEGFLPDEVTVTVALHCYSHSGKVKDGRAMFKSIQDDYGIVPTSQHYDEVVDLLARGGFLGKAEELIENMPFEPSSLTWTTLLSACKLYRTLEPAENAAKRAVELEPANPSPYIVLRAIFFQRLDLREENRALKKKIFSTEPVSASCYTEIKGKVYEFKKDSRHLYMRETDLELFKINRDMIKEGLRKEHQVEVNHPAKRAAIFGVVMTLPGATLRIVKTLKICRECHQALSFMSRKRQIIVRDYTRLHDFKDGACSCGDLWDDEPGSMGGCRRVRPNSVKVDA